MIKAKVIKRFRNRKNNMKIEEVGELIDIEVDWFAFLYAHEKGPYVETEFNELTKKKLQEIGDLLGKEVNESKQNKAKMVEVLESE